MLVGLHVRLCRAFLVYISLPALDRMITNTAQCQLPRESNNNAQQICTGYLKGKSIHSRFHIYLVFSVQYVRYEPTEYYCKSIDIIRNAARKKTRPYSLQPKCSLPLINPGI